MIQTVYKSEEHKQAKHSLCVATAAM